MQRNTSKRNVHIYSIRIETNNNLIKKRTVAHALIFFLDFIIIFEMYFIQEINFYKQKNGFKQ